jgi:hypothetical protein
MLIYNARQENGDWDFDMKVTNQEVAFLVNHSITSLITQGLISLKEQKEEQEIDLSANNEVLN